MVRFRSLSLVAMTCAPIAPRFLIPSLVFLILGIGIQASARRRRTFYTGDKVCLFTRCLLYIRQGHIPLATRSGLTGRVGSARSSVSVIVTCCPRSCLVPLHELGREGELGKEYAVRRGTCCTLARRLLLGGGGPVAV